MLSFYRAPNPEQSLAGTARYRGRNTEFPGEPAGPCLPSDAIPFPRGLALLLNPLLSDFCRSFDRVKLTGASAFVAVLHRRSWTREVTPVLPLTSPRRAASRGVLAEPRTALHRRFHLRREATPPWSTSPATNVGEPPLSLFYPLDLDPMIHVVLSRASPESSRGLSPDLSLARALPTTERQVS